MHADTLTTQAFYLAIKQWAGTVLLGCFFTALLRVSTASTDAGTILGFWAIASILTLILSFFLVVPNMLVLRFVLTGTAHLSYRARQGVLSGIAGSLAAGIGLLLMVVTGSAAYSTDDALVLLAWVVAAAVAGWFARA